MNLSKRDFDWAVESELLSAEQSAALWQAFENRYGDAPKFDFTHLIYYFGAVLIMLAMGWFMGLSFSLMGAGPSLVVSALYLMVFVKAAHYLWYTRQLYVAGGLLATTAVCIVPLLTYSLLNLLGLYPEYSSYQDFHNTVRGCWTAMEVATLLAGVAMLRLIPFPFITAPMSFVLWYMSMDLTPLLFGKDSYSWQEAAWFSLVFGLVMLAYAYWVDLRRRSGRDFAFWLYLFGVIIFWGGLTGSGSGDEAGYFIYFCINLGMMPLSVLLQRKVFVIFGAFGVVGYLGHLAYNVFQDVFLFPIALTFIGLGIIAAAVVYQKNEKRIEARIEAALPAGFKKYLPRHGGGF